MSAGVNRYKTDLREMQFVLFEQFGYDEDSFADAWKKLSPKPAICDGLVLE